MRSISDQECIRLLTAGDIPLSSWFLVGESENHLPLSFWVAELGPRVMMCDDNDLAQACKKYLLKRRARWFASYDEVYAVARRERWPDWEIFCPPAEHG